jgi:hypothetical protein
MVGKIAVALLGIFIIALIGGGVMLAFVNVPAPTQKVEKTLPDAQFPA